MKAILIYSGGLDSTTLLYEFKDCIALVVSEETGNISMVINGDIRTVKPLELKEMIEKEL